MARQVCHLWNLVAEETRKVTCLFACQAGKRQEALGGAVFDVLGKYFRGPACASS